jgi:hypothetical protein
MNEYPYRTDAEQSALEHLPHGPFAFSDKPYLSTERYSLSGFEPRDVEEKRLVDMQGIQDNLYWFNQRKGLL